MYATPVPHITWTQHARARRQQRGITQDSAELLLDWGYYESLHSRTSRVFFRKRDIQRLREQLPKCQWVSIERGKRLFAVVNGDDAVVTIGHRSRHMVRP